jgi:Na+-translocating ferredoxin:NAD+ oxidoreductase RnfA subunit
MFFDNSDKDIKSDYDPDLSFHCIGEFPNNFLIRRLFLIHLKTIQYAIIIDAVVQLFEEVV